MTLRVSSIVVAPATSNVPSIVVLPEAPATINLLVLTIIDPEMLALDVRFNVLTSAVPKVVVPVTPSVPPIRVLEMIQQQRMLMHYLDPCRSLHQGRHP